MELQPRLDRSPTERGCQGLRRDDLLTVVLEQFADRYRGPRRRGAAGYDARAPRRALLLGSPLRDLERAGDRPRGEPANTETFRLLAKRLGLDDPCFQRLDEKLVGQLLEDFPEDDLRERGWVKVDLGQGKTPHGQLHHRGGQADLPRRLRAARRGGRRQAGRPLLALVTAEDAPVPQLDLRQPAAPARSAAHPELVLSPEDAQRRGIEDGTTARVQRPRRVSRCVLASPTTPARAWWYTPMGWWNADYTQRPGPPGHHIQRLTDLGAAPTFNDNRVEVESV